MRHTLLTLALLLCLSIEARDKICLNLGWRFMRSDVPGAHAIDYDDSQWQVVNLPHDAAVGHSFQREGDGANARVGFLPQRRGWYRRHLAYQPQWQGQRVVLEFEGVYRDAKVYVNGTDCGVRQPNGYLDFEIDITSLLRPGDNVIAVAYDNTYEKSSRWYNGEGITRDVWLHVLHPLHVARYGTYITTPKVSAQRALVAVETSVVNEQPDSVLCRLVTELLSPDGHVVAHGEAVAPFAAGETYTFRQQLSVSQPQLWDVGQGRLHRAVSRVYSLGRYPQSASEPQPRPEPTDTYHTTFGIRDIELSPDSGLIVNGRRVYVNGVCLHTDLGPLGTAAFRDAWHQRLTAVTQQLGCNGLRLSHNAYPKYVLQWADEHGVLVVDEFFDKWEDSYYGPHAKMGELQLRDMATQMKRDRCHPSVFMWSVGNEVYQQIQADKTRHGGVDMLRMLVSHARSIDPSRPVTCSQYPNRYGDKRRRNGQAFLAAPPHQFEFYTDVVSTNYLEHFWDRDRQLHPQLVFMAGELAVGDLGYDYFNYDHSYPIGHFYWGGTDYIGESLGWPAKGWTRGLIDFTNRLKPLGQSVRSLHTSQPMVKIVTRPGQAQRATEWNDLTITSIALEEHWNYQPGDTIAVQVMTTCPYTELLLNGRSLGRKALPPVGTPPELVWQVPWQPGELTAIGSNANGQPIVRDTLRTAGSPARLQARLSADTISADGLSLAYIDYTVTDSHGTPCPANDIAMSFTISGNATIAGTASADMFTSEPWHSHTRTTHQGRAQLIVRSTTQQGTITVKAKAKGLKTLTTKITAR